MQFTQVQVDWYNTTFLYYVSVIVVCYIVACKCQNTTILIKNRRMQLSYVLLVTCLLFVKGLGTTGRDLRNGYYYNFCRALSLEEYPDYSVEIGFRFLGIIIRNITNQYAIFIFIAACITIFPIMKMLEKYKKKIDYPSAILIYICVFFFTSFSAIRIAIAAALAMFAFDAMVEKMPYKALGWILIASLFHTSVLILMIPYVVTFWRILDRKIVTAGLFALFILVFLERNSLMTIMANNERYAIYNSVDSVHIGMEQFVYYIPLFCIYNYGRKLDTNRNFSYGRKLDTNRNFSRVAFAYLATGFCFGLLGYIIPIFGRFKDVFLPIIIIVPYYLKLRKKSLPKNRIVINICILLYCVMRFYIYISQYYNLEDLMPYTNIFGWII